MAKTKAELLEEAKKLGIEVDKKAKVAEIQQLIKEASTVEPVAESVSKVTSDEEPVVEAENASQSDEQDEQQHEQDDGGEPQLAKAGKRSAKALKEAEEKEAKEARKASGETAESKPKPAAKPARSRLERRAKGYRKSAEQIEKDKAYSLEEAVELAKKSSHVKFDATVEIHVNLGVDPRQAEQNIRDTLVLPAGTGKAVRVAVLTEDAAGAKSAGADTAGSDDLLAELDKGAINFDILIATPNLMPKLGKYARTLGPRGLMPNPKSGTVTIDVNRAVAEAKAGRVEYRVDSTGIVHVGVGKVSFDDAKLRDNIQALMTSIRANKPQGVKGAYVKAVHLTTSMGPSITLDPNNL